MSDLYLDIQTNLSCNLRCTYCYESFDGSTISLDDVKSHINNQIYIWRSRNEGSPRRVILNVIGGEPLMVSSLVDQIFNFITELVKAEFTSSELELHLSTNLTLINKSSKAIDLIRKYKDKLIIFTSLDGNDQANQFRKSKSGINSINEFTDSLVKLRDELNFNLNKIHITSVIHKFNIPHIKDGLIYLLNLGVGSVKANIDNSVNYSKSECSIIALSYINAINYWFENNIKTQFLNLSKDTPRTITKLNMYDPNLDYGCSLFRDHIDLHGVILGSNGMPYSCMKLTSSKKYKNIVKPDSGSNLNFHEVLPDLCKFCKFISTCDKCVIEELDKVNLNDINTIDSKLLKSQLEKNLPCNITATMNVILKYGEMRSLLSGISSR